MKILISLAIILSLALPCYSQQINLPPQEPKTEVQNIPQQGVPPQYLLEQYQGVPKPVPTGPPQLLQGPAYKAWVTGRAYPIIIKSPQLKAAYDLGIIYQLGITEGYLGENKDRTYMGQTNEIFKYYFTDKEMINDLNLSYEAGVEVGKRLRGL